MKTRYILTAAIALTALSGCMKEQETAPGKFQLRAAIEAPSDTRVSVDNTGKAAWVAGDEIAVYIDNAFATIGIDNPATGDFTIDRAQYDPSKRAFYAVYPASIVASTSASTPLQVTLPTSYNLEGKSADFSPVPMVAVNDPDNDVLYFRHVGGLLRIICGNVPDRATSATVTFRENVTGTFTVNTADRLKPTISNSTIVSGTGGNTVSFTFPAGTTSLVLNIPVPCETYSGFTMTFSGTDTAPLEYNISLPFARQHAKVIAFGIGTFAAEDLKLGELSQVETEYTGGKKEIAQSFVSYGKYGDTKVPVPFILEYSETGEDDTWSPIAPAWLEPDATIDFGGSTAGQKMEISIYPQVVVNMDGHAADLQAKAAADQYPAGAIESGVVNLAKYNVATDQLTDGITTANCYVVKGHGSYKFPAVYGNGVVKGRPNELAYHAMYYDEDQGEFVFRRVDETNTFPYSQHYSGNNEDTYNFTYGYLVYFKDHSNNDITNPYIASHLAGSSFTAEVIWSDVTDLVKDVAVTGSGDNTYITFNVPHDSIRQGNAVIGLKDNDGTIVWSWHIWVTDADLKAVTVPNGQYFAPKSIGWCDTVDDFRYDARQIFVHARQTVTGGKVSDPVKVVSKKGPISQNRGHATLYQWGRKDPMPAVFTKYDGLSTTIVEKTVTGHAPEFVDFPGISITLGDAIQHPYISYYADIHSLQRQAWSSTLLYNYWNSHYYGITLSPGFNDLSPDVEVTKTIYDPSPVGYKVPNIRAFDGMSESNFEWSDIGEDPSDEVYYGNEGRTYGGVFFPSTGYRDAYHTPLWGESLYWSASPKVSHFETPGRGLGFNSGVVVIPRTRVTPSSSTVRPIRDMIESY